MELATLGFRKNQSVDPSANHILEHFRTILLGCIIATSRCDLTGMMLRSANNGPKIAYVFMLLNYHDLFIHMYVG